MRLKLIGLALGLGLVAATVTPSLACPYQNQAASDAQQKTAQAQDQSPTSTQ